MGVEVCLFLKGIDGDTKVRGNLRSKGDLDVSEIAANFGGGGHHAAAGFSNNGTIRETLAVALPMLAELVGEDPASVTVRALTNWMVHGSSNAFSIEYATRRR